MPSYGSQSFVYASSFLDSILSRYATSAAAGIIASPVVDLFTDVGLTPVPGSTSASFTVPLFSGYAAQALTLTSPVNLANGAQGATGSVTFQMTGSTSGVAAQGYFVRQGATYVGGEKFANSATYTFASSGDWLDIVVSLPQQAYQVAQ